MLTMVILSVAGAILAAVIGTFWYSQLTPMGRLHMRYLGFDKLSKEEQEQKIAEAKPQMPKIYGAQMFLSLLTSGAVVVIVTMSMQNGIPLTMALGFVVFNWLCFMVPIYGANILWGNCDRAIAWQKFFSDIGSSLVTVIVIALIASYFA